MKRLIFFTVLSFFSLSVVAFAQDDTAIETVQGLNGYAPQLIVLVWGYIGSKLMKIISGIGWLNTNSQIELTKLVKLFLGAAIPAVLIVLTKELTPMAQYLDTVGIWPLIFAVIGVAKGTHMLDKAVSKNSEITFTNNG